MIDPTPQKLAAERARLRAGVQRVLTELHATIQGEVVRFQPVALSFADRSETLAGMARALPELETQKGQAVAALNALMDRLRGDESPRARRARSLIGQALDVFDVPTIDMTPDEQSTLLDAQRGLADLGF